MLEPRIQSEEPALSYRSVMARVLAELAQETATSIPAGEEDALARSLPDWPIFPDVRAALPEVHQRGWKLVILSNTDRDLIEASMRTVAFEPPACLATFCSASRTQK